MLLTLKQLIAASPVILAAPHPLPPNTPGGALTQPLDWDWPAQVTQIVQDPVILPAPEPPPLRVFEVVDGIRM